MKLFHANLLTIT